ncbi:MAG: WG repeat-containing protein [Clostridia bacterium]|nr:WG repeat-containing protein [Clostridia bacterium]
MKRFLLLLAVFCLCCTAAMAETTVSERIAEVKSLELNEKTNTLILRTDDGYVITDAEGNILSDAYGYLRSRGTYFEVAKEEGLNTTGLLDGHANQVAPFAYGTFESIDSSWVAGIKLVEATAENYDYKLWLGDGYYLVDSVDIFYKGQLKGTLSRMEYSSAEAYGDYLRIRDRESNISFYNSDMVKSPVVNSSSSEYYEDYSSGTITHQGSGQAAFTEGCTLSPENVSKFLYERKKTILDLQGNVLMDLSAYDSVYVQAGSLIKVKNADRLSGLVDITGKEIIPCVYDDLDYDLTSAEAVGYLRVVKNGNDGFVTLATGEEKGFDFADNATRNYTCYLTADDLDGSKIVISAAAGRLPVKYKDFNAAMSGKTSRLAVVQDAEGKVGVIGLMGEEVIPLSDTWKSVYDLNVSDDGSVILARLEYGKYAVYTVNYDPDLSAVPVIDDGTWTCENGHAGNTGKFCSECGAKKPE